MFFLIYKVEDKEEEDSLDASTVEKKDIELEIVIYPIKEKNKIKKDFNKEVEVEVITT